MVFNFEIYYKCFENRESEFPPTTERCQLNCGIYHNKWLLFYSGDKWFDMVTTHCKHVNPKNASPKRQSDILKV